MKKEKWPELDINRRSPMFKAFCQTFFNSSTPSIDLFLARNMGFADIGKLAIVSSILEAETKSAFREHMTDISQDWYSYLFKEMTKEMIDPESYKNFSSNAISFITFNYDRSLEQFLYESLRNSFNIAPVDNIIKQVTEIPIYHVYGVVDNLIELGGETPYRTYYSIDYINRLIKNIKVVHERNLSEDYLAKMKTVIKEAARIFFLGFSYANENLEVLGLPALLDGNQEIYGTALNFTNKEIKKTQEYLRSNFKVKDPQLENPMIVNMDCRMLLRDWL